MTITMVTMMQVQMADNDDSNSNSNSNDDGDDEGEREETQSINFFGRESNCSRLPLAIRTRTWSTRWRPRTCASCRT